MNSGASPAVFRDASETAETRKNGVGKGRTKQSLPAPPPTALEGTPNTIYKRPEGL